MDATNGVVMDQYKRIQGASLFLNKRNKNYPVFKGVNTIGRNKSAVIDIKEGTISQFQAIIMVVDDNQHFLSDLNSSNGTFLHGTKLIPFKLYELTHGADIVFGDISGQYSKHSHGDTTVNVTESIDMTQNMTQNVYAATTQLMFDTTTNDHEFVRPKSRNYQSPTIPSQPVGPSSNTTTNNNQSILEENIHDIATQVVEYPEKMSVVVAPVQYEEVENSIVDSNIHDQPTQVVVLPQSTRTTQDNNETVDKTENKVNVVSTKVTEPASKDTSEEATADIEHSVAVVADDDVHKNSNVPESKSQLDSQATIIDGDDDYMVNLKVQNANSRNTLHSSQIPSTSGIGQASEVNDSIVSNRTTDNVIIEETMMDENLDDNSNGSVDFLTMPLNYIADHEIVASVSPSKKEKLSPSDGSSEDFVESKRKQPMKLNSDSGTDHDESQDIGSRKRRTVRIISDSETDCEDNVPDEKKLSQHEESPNTPTQNIKPVVKSKKVNFDSDSDTDVENEDNIGQKYESKNNQYDGKALNSGSDTDIEDSKPDENPPKQGVNHLNDTDCIPATQDAFAEAFKYKSHLEDGHQSSEESFRLGLTELMVEDEHSTIAAVGQTCSPKNILKEGDKQSEDRNDITDSLESSKKNSVEMCPNENIYDMPTQTDEVIIKCAETLTNNVTLQENLMDQSDDFILPTQNLCFPHTDNLHTMKNGETSGNNTEKPEISADKDIYDLPTQNLCNRSQDKLTEHSEDFILATQKLPDVCVDEYMIPTQKINTEFKVPSKKFTFKKKPVVLEDSMSNILGSDADDDVYMAPTQKMSSNEPSKSDQSDSKSNEKIDEKDDEAYVQPTQCINVENKHVTQSAEEDIYVLATQQLECNRSTNDILKGNNVNLEIEDTFSLPTQVISNEVDGNSQLEITAITETINMPPPPDVHRPTNPLNRVLNSNKTHSKRNNLDQMPSPNQKRIKTSKLDQLKKKTEDVETLSQIEAFVNKPFIKSESKIDDTKNLLTDKTSHSNELEKTETLSQIDAFIKSSTKEVQELSKSKKDIEQKIDVNKPQNTAELQISKDDVVTNMFGTKNVEDNFKKNKTTANDTADTDLMETSTDFGKDSDIRSDIDASFALLESKITKVKRTSRMHADLGEITAIPLNRRSMALVEIEEVQDTLPSRKSRRITGNNIQQTKRKAAPNKSRKKSVGDSLASDIPTKKSRISIQEKKFPGEGDAAQLNGADLSNTSSIAVHKKNKYETNLSSSVSKVDDKEPEVSAELSSISKQTTKEKVLNSTTSKNVKRQSRKTRYISESKNEDVENNNQEHQKSIIQHSKLLEIDNRTSAEPSTSDEPVPKVTAGSSRKTKKQLLDIDGEYSKKLLEKNKSKCTSRTKTKANRGLQSNISIDEFSTPTKQQGNYTLDNLNSSAERAKRKIKHKVVFTMMDNPDLESCIRQLGGSVVDSVDYSTVLITQQVKRSQKLLTAVGQGKPVCSPEWIEASKKNREFLDPWDFILIDKEAESKWNFSLKESLQRANETKLLKNYSFQIMVGNAVEVLKSAIESCGGKVLSRNPGKKFEGTFVIIATPEHKSKYSKSLKQHPDVKVVEPEAIFDGVLRQELRLSKHLLT